MHLYQGSNSLAPRQTNSRRPRPLPRRRDVVYGGFCTLSYTECDRLLWRCAGQEVSLPPGGGLITNCALRKGNAPLLRAYSFTRIAAALGEKIQTKKGRRFFEKRNSNKHSASVEDGSSGSFILFISITIVATAFLNEREPATPEEATKNI